MFSLLVLMTWSVMQVRLLQISQCGEAPCVRGHPNLQNIKIYFGLTQISDHYACDWNMYWLWLLCVLSNLIPFFWQKAVFWSIVVRYGSNFAKNYSRPLTNYLCHWT